jgi:hypothetical protein
MKDFFVNLRSFKVVLSSHSRADQVAMPHLTSLPLLPTDQPGYLVIDQRERNNLLFAS